MEFTTFICMQLFIYIFRVGGTTSNGSACRDELYPNLWPTVSLRYGGKLNSLKLWSRESSLLQPCCWWPAGTWFAMFCTGFFFYPNGPRVVSRDRAFLPCIQGRAASGSKGDAKDLRQKSNRTETARSHSAPLRCDVTRNSELMRQSLIMQKLSSSGVTLGCLR